MESILDFLNEIADMGLDAAREKAQLITGNNPQAEKWLNDLAKQKDQLLGRQQSQSSTSNYRTSTANQPDEEDEDDDYEDYEEEMPVKKNISNKAKTHNTSEKKEASKKQVISSSMKEEKQYVAQVVDNRWIQNITPAKLQEGIILSEILGAPVSKQRRSRVGRR